MAHRYPSAEIMAALRATDGAVYLAAKRLGCDPETIYKRMRKEPKIRATVDNARGEFVDTAETALKRAVLQGEAWAVCFALKCQGKDRGYVERSEASHEHRHQHEHRHEHHISLDEFRKLPLEERLRLCRTPLGPPSGN